MIVSKHKKSAAASAFVGVLCLSVAFANAEEGEKDDWEILIALGASLEPVGPGLSETQVEPSPHIDIKYKEMLFVNQYGAGGYVYKVPDQGADDGLGIGLSIGLADGRDEKDYETYLKGMGDIDEGLEAVLSVTGEAGMLEYEWMAAKGLNSDGHDGVHSQLELNIGGAIMRNFFFEAGPFVHYGDDTYMQSFYGVTPEQAALSRFDEYTPSAGVDQIGVSVLGMTRLTEHWVLLGEVEFHNLLGDAKDSPITEDENWVTFGLALGYMF